MKFTALYVYIAFLHSLMTPMTLGAPVAYQNNLEPDASGLMPYSRTVPAVRPEVFRRAGPAIGNENTTPVSSESQTTTTTTTTTTKTSLFTSELAELLRLNKIIPSNRMNGRDKSKIPLLLRRLSENLEAANSRGDLYPTKDGIYNAVQGLLNGIYNNVHWIKGQVRDNVMAYSMRCLERTKPPNKRFSKLPRESDLMELSGRIENNDDKLRRQGWGGLKKFLKEIKQILEMAKRERFSYDKEVVKRALGNVEKAVEVWDESDIKWSTLSILKECRELNT